jgi:hypothetical protein
MEDNNNVALTSLLLKFNDGSQLSLGDNEIDPTTEYNLSSTPFPKVCGDIIGLKG